MPAIATTYQTPDAQKYLTQMCKHFAHKVAVTFEGEDKAHCLMPQGPLDLAANDESLEMHFDVGNPDHIQQAIFVVEIHLMRFAWRAPVDLVWQNTATGETIPRSDKLEAALKDQRDKNAARRDQ